MAVCFGGGEPSLLPSVISHRPAFCHVPVLNEEGAATAFSLQPFLKSARHITLRSV